ncbi:protein vascular associated death 1 [Anaeramoeba flamelloides]|uniref:Protein vascular associated death 1 n=1 Tax=Anaeramoeba flamelloides TaxID=1746091 RepID=A0ABQ8Y3H1_9EUKA|nr:protein vascular associated death 1 [Anaeramoeba flamelloides]
MSKISIKKIQTKFHLSSKEPILQQYRCALRENNGLLRQGWLFLTPLSILFYSRIIGFRKRLKIPLSKCSMIYATTFLKFSNSIKIVRRDKSKSWFLTSFLSRDQCLQDLQKIFKEYKKNEALRLLNKNKSGFEKHKGDDSSGEIVDIKEEEEEGEEEKNFANFERDIIKVKKKKISFHKVFPKLRNRKQELSLQFNIEELDFTNSSQSSQEKKKLKNSRSFSDSEFEDEQGELYTTNEKSSKKQAGNKKLKEKEKNEKEIKKYREPKTENENQKGKEKEIKVDPKPEKEFGVHLDFDSKIAIRKEKGKEKDTERRMGKSCKLKERKKVNNDQYYLIKEGYLKIYKKTQNQWVIRFFKILLNGKKQKFVYLYINENNKNPIGALKINNIKIDSNIKENSESGEALFKIKLKKNKILKLIAENKQISFEWIKAFQFGLNKNQNLFGRNGSLLVNDGNQQFNANLNEKKKERENGRGNGNENENEKIQFNQKMNKNNFKKKPINFFNNLIKYWGKSIHVKCLNRRIEFKIVFLIIICICIFQFFHISSKAISKKIVIDDVNCISEKNKKKFEYIKNFLNRKQKQTIIQSQGTLEGKEQHQKERECGENPRI